MRVVLDSNSLLVCIGRKSRYRPIFDGLLQGTYTLLISNDILTEYEEVFERKTNAIIAENVAQFLITSPFVEQVNIYFKWAAIYKDGDDNKFVDCALNGRADLLVSDDNHFNSLSDMDYPSLEVVRTEGFLEICNELK